MKNDRLTLDCADDLARIDQVMTTVVNDRGVWDEFKNDPNGVFVRLGLHPKTTPAINERANRIFYATLTNKPLIDFLVNHFKGFSSERMVEYREYFVEGLKSGVLQNRVDFDLEVMDHVLDSPEAVRKIYGLSLHNLNDQGILSKKYPPEEIDRYVEELAKAVAERRAVDEFPVLEEYDQNYGIGRKYGNSVAEVGPAATVEAVAAGTVAIPVEVLGVTEESLIRSEFAVSALAGDPEAGRAFATISRLMHLGSDLLLHAYNLEK